MKYTKPDVEIINFMSLTSIATQWSLQRIDLQTQSSDSSDIEVDPTITDWEGD